MGLTSWIQHTYLSNGLSFFERCILIIATVCAYKLITRVSENLFAHNIVVIRLHFSKKRTSHCLYLHFKNLSFNAFESFIIIMYALSLGCITIMEQPLEQHSYCDVRSCGKKKRKRGVNILFIWSHWMKFRSVS